MGNYSVDVSYDAASGWVFNPPTVNAVKGSDNISFNPNPRDAPWNFSGFSIWPASASKPNSKGSVCNPFDSPPPVINNNLIMLTDNNNATSDQVFQYQIWIRLGNGTEATSDPQIINKGG